MSLDAGAIGTATAKLMDMLEEEYPEGELTGALVIAEVAYIDEDGDECHDYRWKTNDGRPSATTGMATYVLMGMLR